MTGSVPQAQNSRGEASDKAAGAARAALAQLRWALAQAMPRLDLGDAADLAAITDALDRIAARQAGDKGHNGARNGTRPGSAPVDDPARLDRLLDLAGPADAPELLRRIRSDLAAAARQIAAALPGPDRLALRAATHVLIAVGGAVGALRLEAASRALNQAAHVDPGTAADSDAQLHQLAAPVLDGLRLLSNCLSTRAEGPPA